ncbi:MAG: hypothetical protein NTV01_14285 [Bacteroidia bacterium]|nr:hypothetical protein [Bacteroidia bacterium]
MKTKSIAEDIPPLDRSLTQKPPMGWNSWDCLGWGATEAEVKASADYMAKNLKGLGYEYIVIDMLWYGDSAASDFEALFMKPFPSGQIIPSISSDACSRSGKVSIVSQWKRIQTTCRLHPRPWFEIRCPPAAGHSMAGS